MAPFHSFRSPLINLILWNLKFCLEKNRCAAFSLLLLVECQLNLLRVKPPDILKVLACLLFRCSALWVIAPTPRGFFFFFNASSTFPKFLGFSVQPLPAPLPTFPGAMQTDNKSRRVIYGGLDCARRTSDVYGNSSHGKATGCPGEGASGWEREKGRLKWWLLAFWASRTVGGGEDASQCVVGSTLYSWTVRKGTCSKRDCVWVSAKESGVRCADAAQGVKLKRRHCSISLTVVPTVFKRYVVVKGDLEWKTTLCNNILFERFAYTGHGSGMQVNEGTGLWGSSLEKFPGSVYTFYSWIFLSIWFLLWFWLSHIWQDICVALSLQFTLYVLLQDG